jgi:hypothetical protein
MIQKLLFVLVALAASVMAVQPKVVFLTDSIRAIQPDGMGGVCYVTQNNSEWNIIHHNVTGNALSVATNVATSSAEAYPQFGCVGETTYYLSWNASANRHDAFLRMGTAQSEPLQLHVRSYHDPRSGRWLDMPISEYLTITSQGGTLFVSARGGSGIVWLRLDNPRNQLEAITATNALVRFDEVCTLVSGPAYGMTNVGNLTTVVSLNGLVYPASLGSLYRPSLFGWEESHIACENNGAVHVFRNSEGMLLVRDLLTGVATNYGDNTTPFLDAVAINNGTVYILQAENGIDRLYALENGQTTNIPTNLISARGTNWPHQVNLVASGNVLYVARYSNWINPIKTGVSRLVH